MPDFVDFIPLAQETIDTVRARLDTDINAGIDPASEDWIDTTEGGFYFDITQVLALEIARLWDFATTEVPAACFPAYAWGEYLDDHGETLGLARKEASQATGTVTFTGTNGTLITQGTEVSTQPTGDDDDPINFTTDVDVTIASGTATVAVTAEEFGSAGNVAANTVTVLVTPNDGVASVTNPLAITGGSDVETDENYRERILIQLGAGSGGGTVSDYESWALAYPGIGTVTVTPVWNGAGTVHVVVADENNNPVSDTVQYGLQDQLDPPQFLTSTTAAASLPDPTIDVVTTTGAAASGTFRLGDQTITYTGKTATTFTGCTGGTGSYAIGERVAQGFGQGRGLAPIGAVVTVDTVTQITFAVAATITFEPGYSLDGSAGTIATRSDIENEIATYINGLGPGEDVIWSHVLSRVFRVRGVEDIPFLDLDGGGTYGNVTVAPLEVAYVDPSTDITLT